jgi:hypothetical protein
MLKPLLHGLNIFKSFDKYYYFSDQCLINYDFNKCEWTHKKKIEEKRLICDNVPHAISAGIVYFICQLCQLAVSKTDIKSICGVSEVTINKCYKKIENMKLQLIPDCILNKYM